MVDVKSFPWVYPVSERECDDPDVTVEQYVQDVKDFSSQYGSDISISYTAYNISGKPSKFPDYGDFPQAFVMRTYGKWWNDAPSKPIPIMTQNSQIVSEDYIDITFEQEVYPEKVSIFETFNPGSVVRIWAGDGEGLWKLLWEGEPQIVGHRPRIFSPEIRPIDFMTSLLRIEFNHSQLDYYTELDAVLLVGSRVPNKEVDFGKITSQIKGFKINAITNDVDILTIHKDLSSLVDSLLEDIDQEIDTTTGSSSGPFSDLPDETILRIFGYLDLISLRRCVRVNKHFSRLANDAMLYTGLNLKPYWFCVNSNALNTLSSRCLYLQKLDLSWCGNYDQITPAQFSSFINTCGKQITHLRLDCCKYIDDDCIKQVAYSCRNLKELSLRNCFKISVDGFHSLTNITTFQRLDLYRTAIEGGPLVKILKQSPKLQHINLGSCVRVSAMDEVAHSLGTYNRQLISVDFWKTYSLTPSGVKSLANCSQLEEIDLGWCLGVSIPGECLTALAAGCPKLRKLFVASLRGITDRDLIPFINNCPHLQQVDLLGIRNITPQICYRFLNTCKELRLFDLSFCDLIQDSNIQMWRNQFPHVSIKRSFQRDGVPSPFQHY
ncbi:F-box/LRR-repeat protein 4 [Cimex lectularius]|uniref:F-box domain-containing protein n=1 Tax=Cimex lectularius TaxID=79782 RepID=A0A8I6TBZ6_CIMLE|nr:F-box/LRR-repeat protein 4 [Cimex lectularius]